MAYMQDMPSMTSYVRMQLERHVPENEIVRDLTVGGWQPEMINKVLANLGDERRLQAVKENHHRDFMALKHLMTVIMIAILGFLAIAYVIGGD